MHLISRTDLLASGTRLAVFAILVAGSTLSSAQAKNIKVCLKAHTGKVMQAQQQSNTFNANRTQCGKWQRLTVVDTNGGELRHLDEVELKTAYNQFISATKVTRDGTTEYAVAVNRKKARAWEKWTIVRRDGANRAITSGDSIGLKSTHGRFMVVEPGAASQAGADRTKLSRWETFTLMGATTVPSLPTGKARRNAISRALKSFRETHQVPGVVVGLIDVNAKGKPYVDTLLASGYRDPFLRAPMQRMKVSTPMRWASISKTLTAVTALQLVEQGQLSLKKHVRDYLPAWKKVAGLQKPVYRQGWRPGFLQRIQVGHLLRNTGGISHYGRGVDGTKIEPECEYTRMDLVRKMEVKWDSVDSLQRFDRCPLVARPGTRFHYSSPGFNLLGAVVDKAGMGYLKQVDQRVKNRLGLTSLMTSGEYCKANTTKHPSSFHVSCYRGANLADGKKKAVWVNGINWKLPSGGWVSNIKDLTKFTLGLMTPGRLLKKPKFLWTKTKYGVANHYYKYGIKTRRTDPNHLFVYHDGIDNGVRTLFAFLPQQKKGIAIMMNQKHAPIDELAHQLFEYLDVSY